MFRKSSGYNDLAPTAKLWRYMSYSKFADMLKTSSLYFCRLDLFDDKLEATQPEGSAVFMKTTENPWQVFERYCLDNQLRIMRGLTFANCWHINENENLSMWINYVMHQGNEGVAIQTTLKDLTSSILSSRVVSDVRMKYVDYGSYFMDYFMANPFEFLQIKDKSFEYENELRLITVEDTYPIFDDDDSDFWHKVRLYEHHGERICVDLHRLIKNVYVSPNATDQFKFNVAQLLSDYNFNIPIIQSK